MAEFVERKKEEKTTKALESKMEENFQELMTKMKALNEDFQKLRKSAHCEVQLIRASLESKQEKKEEEISRALLSRIEKEFQQLLETSKTLEKDLWKLPESTKHELQLLRIDLEKNQGKKEEEIARALESRMKNKFKQLSQRIKTLKKDLHEWQESTKHELQLLRPDP